MTDTTTTDTTCDVCDGNGIRNTSTPYQNALCEECNGTGERNTPTENTQHNTQPVITSFRQLIPEFPLDDGEALLAQDTWRFKGDSIINPVAVAPGKQSDGIIDTGYYVDYEVYRVMGTVDDGTPMISDYSNYVHRRSIGRFMSFVDDLQVLSIPDDTVTPEQYDGDIGTDATVYFHAESRGDPGNGATGHVIETRTQSFENTSVFDNATHTEAQYYALNYALENALQLGIENISIYGDSELIITHLNENRTADADDVPTTLDETKSLLNEFNSWEIQHVNRDENTAPHDITNQRLKNMRMKRTGCMKTGYTTNSMEQ